MKEFTIEEKAQRYDEALERARIACKDEDKHLKATLESIFPELAESEDERIRKELIDYINRLTASPLYIDKYNGTDSRFEGSPAGISAQDNREYN